MNSFLITALCGESAIQGHLSLPLQRNPSLGHLSIQFNFQLVAATRSNSNHVFCKDPLTVFVYKYHSLLSNCSMTNHAFCLWEHIRLKSLMISIFFSSHAS